MFVAVVTAIFIFVAGWGSPKGWERDFVVAAGPDNVLLFLASSQIGVDDELGPWLNARRACLDTSAGCGGHKFPERYNAEHND